MNVFAFSFDVDVPHLLHPFFAEITINQYFPYKPSFPRLLVLFFENFIDVFPFFLLLLSEKPIEVSIFDTVIDVVIIIGVRLFSSSGFGLTLFCVVRLKSIAADARRARHHRLRAGGGWRRLLSRHLSNVL